MTGKHTPYIRLTRPKIKEIFDECNRLFFNNEVETPHKFELWTPSKNCVAWVRASFNKKRQCYIISLHVSSRYRWTEENLRDTIVHEMIHLHIKDYLVPLTFWQRIFPNKQHNSEFRLKMAELNETHGLNIVVQAKHMRKEYIK